MCHCSVREHKYFLNFHIIVNHVYHRVSGILASFHPDVDLRDCPVLVTQPPPTIVHTDNSGRDGEAGAKPATALAAADGVAAGEKQSPLTKATSAAVAATAASKIGVAAKMLKK